MKSNKSFLWLLLFIFLTTYNLNFLENIKNFPLYIKFIEIKGAYNSDIKEINEKIDPFKGRSLIFISRK